MNTITYQNFKKLHQYVTGIWLLFLPLLILTNKVYSQVGCSVPVSCNGNVQVSLNTSCEEVITAKALVKYMAFPETSYRVVVKDNRGRVIPGNLINSAYIGQRLEVTVFLDTCGTSCWGYAWIEDKLPPIVENCDTVTVDCGANTNPVTGIARPVVTESCSNITYKNLPDIVQKLPCPNEFEKIIRRPWIFTDSYGNSSSCTQVIRVKRTSLSQVTGPKSYDDIELPVLECGIFNDFLSNGSPDPDSTGFPSNIACENIKASYKDIFFPLCGNGKKILREWLIIDWCTGEDTIINQVIKIVDKRGPQNPVHPVLVNLKTDQKKCSATYKVPHPGATDCSSYGYIIGFREKDIDGVFGDTIYHSPRIISNPDNTYTLLNVGLDTTIIIYKMTDACSNISYSNMQVVVQDKESPSANCEGFLVVSLKENGWAELSAQAVNSGSTDNCGIVKYEIRRLNSHCPGFAADTTYKSSVNFCCKDINPSNSVYIKVVLRVTDASGNINECISNVRVQDKIAPVFTYCPSNTVLECYQDWKDLTLTGGSPAATDNCGVRITMNPDVVAINKCGVGTVTRSWVARDSQGTTATCTQVITLVNSNPFNSEHVIFPNDTTIHACYNPGQLSPDFLNSKPKPNPLSCADLAISYTDDYYQVDNACHKIIRTWRVIDWCTYSINNSNFITGIQKILIQDKQGPTVTFGCVDRSVSAQDGCNAVHHHRIEATDNCTPSNLLKYTWEIDLNSDQTIDDKGFGAAVSDTFPTGKHLMTYRVVDGCGNETICRYTFTVVNNKKPTPVCLGEVVVVLDNTGKVAVWAKDFDLKSESFCGTNRDLRFAFSSNVLDTGRVFTCADINNGVSARIPVRMYVFDANNNFDFCDVTLVLQDSPSNNACPNSLTDGGTISGKIVNSKMQNAQSVNVILEDANDHSVKKAITNEEGIFSFSRTTFNKNYMLKPEKMDEIDMGVNTLDLVTLQRHILGIQRLTTPYHLIAADVDNDKKIQLSDLVALRKIILGISGDLPNNRPWRFVPRDFKFQDGKPFDLKEVKVYENLEIDDMAADFMMIKVGDVDAAFTNNSLFGRSSTTQTKVCYEYVNDQIKVYAGQEIHATGMEFSIGLTDFVNILPGSLHLEGTDAYFENQKLKIAWVSKTGGQLIKQNDLLFTIFVNSNSGGNLVNLSSEWYNTDLETNQIELVERNKRQVFGKIAGFPNPFTDKSTLSFQLPADETINLIIYDQQGREVYKNKLKGVKGENKHTILRSDLQGTGVYLLNLRGSEINQTIKLFLIR
jgi:hypothetical protein